MDLDPNKLKPGIYYNVPEDVYFQIPALHNSLLSTMDKQSEAHAIHYAIHGKPASKSQKIGSALHKALLEPKKYLLDAIPYLTGHGNTKRVRNSKKVVKKLYPNAKSYVKLEEYREYQNQVKQAKDNEIGRALFPKLKTEVTLIAEDPVTGLPLKCRWDGMNFDIGMGLDYKTTRNANPKNFVWDIWNYGYYRQVAFYLFVAELLGIDMRQLLILAQEKKPPYVAVWYDLKKTAIAKGKREVRELINQFARCIENGKFKGYVNPTTNRNILSVDLPDRAYEIEDEII